MLKLASYKGRLTGSKKVGSGLLCLTIIWLNLVLAACSDSTTATPDSSAKNLPSDRILFLSNRDGWPDLYTMDTSGKVTGRLTTSAEAEYGAVWSPDGRSIAYTALNGDQAAGSYQQQDVYVMDADGSNRRLVAQNSFNPLWSPDGKQLLVTRALAVKTSTAASTHAVTASPNPNAGDDIPTPAPAPNSNLQTKLGLYLVTIADNNNGQAAHLVADNAVAGSWSPDGKRIAYIGGNNVIDQKRSLNLINSDGSGQVSVSEQAKIPNLDVLYVAWSPDGTEIAFSAVDPDLDKMILYRISPAGGAPRRLADYAGSGHEALGLIWAYADFANPAPRLHFGPAWSPNSQQIAFTSGSNQLVVVNASTGNLRYFPVGSAALGQDTDSVLNVSWQADNRHLFYDRARVGRNSLLQQAANYIYDFFDESLESLDTVNKNVQTLSSESGSFLAPTCCGMDLLGAGGPDATPKPTATVKVTPSVQTQTSVSGKLVYTSGVGQRQLVVSDLKSGQRNVLESGSFRLLDFSIAPTGDRLAYLKVDANFNATLYTSTLDGKQKHQLSSGTGTPDDLTTDVIWSPDGREVAFKALNGDKNLGTGLYVFNTTGADNVSTAPHQITKEEVSAFAWSPDSHNLAYKVDRVTYNIFVVAADSPAPYPSPLVQVGIASSRYGSLERGLAWSPDGHFLVFGGGDTLGRFSTWILNMQAHQNMAVPGPVVTRILGWTPDSTHLLVVVATSTQSTEVEALHLQGTEGAWRSYGEGTGPLASSDSSHLAFFTQHILPPDFYNSDTFSSGSNTVQPHLSLVNLTSGYQNDLKFKYPPYFGFKGRFYAWSPDGKMLAYYENNSIYSVNPDATGLKLLARAFAVDRLAWVASK